MATATAGRLMTALRWVSLALVVIGALNWGAVGLVGFDVIAGVFGVGSPITQALYVLVGAAGAFTLGEAMTPSRAPALTTLSGKVTP